MNIPVVALTMGDPNGIGPEIIVKTLRSWDFPAKPLVIGDRMVLREAERLTGPAISWEEGDWNRESLAPAYIDISDKTPHLLEWGTVRASAGLSAFQSIKKAIELAREGLVDAISTAPINKEALHQAEVPFIGHTEIFQELTGSDRALTMFQVKDLRVFFLTRHLSLSRAIEEVRREPVIRFLKDMYGYLRRLGLAAPRIAVAALNPHAGEGGLIGREEQDELEPAVAEARRHGMEVSGPYPADSIFWFAYQGKYDAVLSLYHDQGHIATKCIDFYGTVSVTLGLPFIRTSPDHGTAFDLAGKGTANEHSMKEACRWASRYALSYRESL
ncbi:MAG TPA: 4-hydroxythreonine-4-phosphate dehydrogenase PdxA [Atribacteraceae bacterium]|nr:4-hydroxythreonine-4-phosphate dehydrogenase PdxA [Atribacteraceae bacterium]